MNTILQEQTNDRIKKERVGVTEHTLDMARQFCERIAFMDRMAHAKEIAGNAGLPIYFPQREEDLLAQCRQIAQEYGVDEDMMDQFILYLIFVGSSAQKKILNRSTTLDKNAIDPKILRKDLLTLTASIARTYEQYDAHAYGTHYELIREQEILTDIIGITPHRDTALNLGCATGTFVTEILGEYFRHAIGYDISQEMITEARSNFPDYEFRCYDLAAGIPYRDSSVDFLVANLGAASEVTQDIWTQAQRLLRPGGSGYFSFYNKNALSTKWQTSRSNAFRILVNPYNDTVSVPFVDADGSSTALWIHGKTFTEEEVRSSAQNSGLKILSIESAGPQWDNMPPWFFHSEEAVASSSEYDITHGHIPPYLGPYLNVSFSRL